MLLAACKKHEPPKKEAPPDPRNPSRAELPWFEDLADAPVSISAVTVKPQRLHGYDQALPVSYTVTGKRAIVDRTVLMVKASCRVGAQVIASAVPALIELRELDASTPTPLTTTPFQMYGFVGTAQPCELSWYLDRQEPGTRPQRFLTQCWSSGSVVAGRCADLAPRPGIAPFTLSSVTAALAGDQLGVDATIVVGPGRTGDETVKLVTRCELDGEVVDGEILGLSNLGFLSSGEAFRTTGAVPAAAPTWCEVHVVIDRMVSGAPTELGTRCLRDAKLTEGAC